MVSEEDLARAEAQAITWANETIEMFGDEQGARILRIWHGVLGRKISDCERIVEMRAAYTKLAEPKPVPSRPVLFVIEGGR